MTVHVFEDSLLLEKAASPLLNQYYYNIIPDLLGIVDVSKKRDFQNIGVDKYLFVQNPGMPKFQWYAIDEKVRSRPWNDFAVEIISVLRNDNNIYPEYNVPGWVWTSHADFIVYAFYNAEQEQFFEEPFFISLRQLKLLIKSKNYKAIRSLNRGYQTVCNIIPKSDVEREKIYSPTLLNYFP